MNGGRQLRPILLVGRSCGINSSIMLWNASKNSNINFGCNFIHYMYAFLKDNFSNVTRAMYKFDHFLEVMLANSDGNFKGVLFLQDQYPDKIIDFQSAERIFKDGVDVNSNDASVICFPLQPKPHDVCDKAWVQKYWKLF